MPALPTEFNRKATILFLREILDEMTEEHKKEMRAIGNRLPVGGAYIDLFFKVEGTRILLKKIVEGKTLEYALKAGMAEAKFCVEKWNSNHKKEYQVHRWVDCTESFLWGLFYRIIKL